MCGLQKYKEREKLKTVWQNTIFWIAGITSLAGLYFSYTRGAIVGFFIALIFSLYFISKKMFYYSVSTLVFFFLVYLLIVQSSILSGNRLFQPLASDSNTIRLSQFQTAIYAVKESPVWGLGWRRVEAESLRIKADYNLPHPEFRGHAHNVFLQIAADTGVVGFVLFVLFLFFWFKESLSKPGWQRRYVPPVIIAFVVAGLFQAIHIDAENTYFLMHFFAFSYLPTFLDAKFQNLTRLK